MTTTETVFNVPCREGSLDIIVKGDSSFDLNDSPLLVSPPKVFIHCTCGALHSPGVEPKTDTPTDQDVQSRLLKTVSDLADFTLPQHVVPCSTSSPIKPVSGSTKKNSLSPELHFHEHYHYLDEDDNDGYTSDLEHVAKSAKNEKQRNKILSKTLTGSKPPNSLFTGGKVSSVSFCSRCSLMCEIISNFRFSVFMVTTFGVKD